MTKKKSITAGLPKYAQPTAPAPIGATQVPPRQPPRPAPTSAAAVEKCVVLLVSMTNQADVEKACLEKLAIPAASVNRVIAAARRKITLAADYHRDEQIGKGLKRYEDLYQRSLQIQDCKTALAAQKEIARLLGLNRRPEANIPKVFQEDEAARIKLIGEHLVPLGLAPKEHPAEEHARIAALTIIRAGLAPNLRNLDDVKRPATGTGETQPAKV